MIRKEDFYTRRDIPRPRTMNAMWLAIRRLASPLRSDPWIVRDRRSFVYGMAATLILGLALVGAWTIARQAFENSRPEPLRQEQAYLSAIQEFERVLPSVSVRRSLLPRVRGQLTQRDEQLKQVDAAIADLRRQTNGTDLSPLKRERLLDLYSMKLRILQQMITEEEGTPL
jgi:hypothetical protein